MFARATSKGAGSRARGEGRERGNLPNATPKPPVAQGAGGIKKKENKIILIIIKIKKKTKKRK